MLLFLLKENRLILHCVRLPSGQLLLPWPMVINVNHREKSPSRFAPKFQRGTVHRCYTLQHLCRRYRSGFAIEAGSVGRSVCHQGQSVTVRGCIIYLFRLLASVNRNPRSVVGPSRQPPYFRFRLDQLFFSRCRFSPQFFIVLDLFFGRLVHDDDFSAHPLYFFF